MFRNHPEVIALAVIVSMLTLVPLASERVAGTRYRVLKISEPGRRIQVEAPSSCELSERILRSLGR